MSKIFLLLKSPYLYLILIILLGFYVRLYKIDRMVADWHSWRQADTAAVARNFFKEGFNPLIPKYDDMSPVSEGNLPNPNRLRFVEFPIYPSLIYFSYLINGGVDVKFARLISVFFSLGSMVLIYLITKRYMGVVTALLASLLFAILPFSIFYSRVILPEPSLVFFSLGMLYFTDRWIYEGKIKLYLLGIFFTAAAFLTKPYAVFYLLPLIYSYIKKEGKFLPIPKRYFLFFIPALLPFVGWRVWMSQFPEGIPRSSWLLNGNGIRFRPSFWWWILVDRFGREILSVTGIVLFFIGLIIKPFPKESPFLHLFAMSSFLFIIVFATGNVQHDYYQAFIVPALVIFLARGAVLLIKGVNSFVPRVWTIPLALLFLVLTIYFGWREVKGLYQINNDAVVVAGEVADKILPKNAIVAAPYGGDTALLYHTNRPGWSVLAVPIEELGERYGVNYFVSVTFDEDTKNIMKKYKILVQDPRYVIIDLTQINLQ